MSRVRNKCSSNAATAGFGSRGGEAAVCALFVECWGVVWSSSQWGWHRNFTNQYLHELIIGKRLQAHVSHKHYSLIANGSLKSNLTLRCGSSKPSFSSRAMDILGVPSCVCEMDDGSLGSQALQVTNMDIESVVAFQIAFKKHDFIFIWIIPKMWGSHGCKPSWHGHLAKIKSKELHDLLLGKVICFCFHDGPWTHQKLIQPHGLHDPRSQKLWKRPET